MARRLIAGPWVGEFGWEIMKWVPYIRWLVWKHEYEQVTIICQSGHEFLYRDFADEYIIHDVDGQKNCWTCYTKIPAPDVGEGDIVRPSAVLKYTDNLFYKAYCEESKRPDKIYDILIHARNTNNFESNNRNWPQDRFEAIARHLSQRGIRIASIGSSKAAAHIEGSKDLRNISLSNLVDIMTHARLVIGPSSGAMHLAALCFTPCLVWTDREIQGGLDISKKYTNRDRYEKLWNPFSSKVIVLDRWGWQPSAHFVLKQIISILKGSKWKRG